MLMKISVPVTAGGVAKEKIVGTSEDELVSMSLTLISALTPSSVPGAPSEVVP